MSDDRFTEMMEEAAQEPFQPTCFYNQPGDSIEFHTSRDAYLAERVDELVTVFLSKESKNQEGEPKIIGACIKGVKKLLKNYPGLQVSLQGSKQKDGKVQVYELIHLGFLKNVNQHSKPLRRTYERLKQLASTNHLEAEVIFA